MCVAYSIKDPRREKNNFKENSIAHEQTRQYKVWIPKFSEFMCKNQSFLKILMNLIGL